MSSTSLLTECPLPLIGQSFAVVALAPMAPLADTEGSPTFAINIIGTFPSEKDAQEFVKKANHVGFDQFDIYITMVNKFVPMPPPKDLDAQYTQTTLNQFFQEYKKALKKRADGFETEKAAKMMAEGLKEGKSPEGPPPSLKSSDTS